MDGLIHNFKWNTFIELVIFFIAVSFGLSETVLIDEILLKTCQKALGEYSNNCSTSNSLLSLRETTTILALKSFVENFVPAVVCIFFGIWSDVIGRKPILLIALINSVIYYVSVALLSYYNVDVYWYLAASIITSIFGGFPMAIMACYCYAADITKFDGQFHRLNLIDLTIFAGKLVGCLAYPAIVKQFGYWITFAISAYSCLMGLCIAVILLKETVSLDRNSSDESVLNSISVKTTTSFRALFTWLTTNSSDLLWFTLFVVTQLDDNVQGTSATLYLYTKQFQWNLSDFSIYTVARFLIMMIGLISFSSRFITLRLPGAEISVIAIGVLSNLGCAFTRAFANASWQLYLAATIGAFNWIPTYFTRNLVLKQMTQKYFGQEFATIIALERTALSFIVPFNVYLCTEYISTYPHLMWFTHITLYLSAFLLYAGLLVHFFRSMARNVDD